MNLIQARLGVQACRKSQIGQGGGYLSKLLAGPQRELNTAHLAQGWINIRGCRFKVGTLANHYTGVPN